MQLILSNLYALALGAVNAFLLQADDGLVLIDTGFPGSAAAIEAGVQALGRQLGDIRHIVVTHGHVDHAGSLAELKRRTGAVTYLHEQDAPMVAAGRCWREQVEIAPGLEKWLLFHLLIKRSPRRLEAVAVDQTLADGDRLPLAGGLQVVHAPGHCAGQVALLWEQHGGVLFAADTAGHLAGLRMSINYEHVAQGRADLARLATFEFEHALFGHGRPLLGQAAHKFRRKWGE